MHAVRYFCDGVPYVLLKFTILKQLLQVISWWTRARVGLSGRLADYESILSLSLREPAREVRQKLEDAFHPPARSWGEWWLHCSRPFSHSYSRKTLPSAESTALAVTLKPCLVYLPIVSAPSAHFICTHSGRDVGTRWFIAYQNIVVWYYTGF